MNRLFNERVVSAQPMSRDLSSSSSGGFLPGTHSGTKTTTESGKQYLVHHGTGYAAAGDLRKKIILNVVSLRKIYNILTIV
jgi:hypothetical protein